MIRSASRPNNGVMPSSAVRSPDAETARGSNLVLSHLALARSIAGRYRGRGAATDDLQQVAYLGLVKAAARFDPDRGTAFSTYATATVTGELRRHFRDARWPVHVGRRAQERYLAVQRALELAPP